MSADEQAGSGALHEPVLLNEVVTMLKIEPNMTCIDATLGLGGHAAALLAAAGPGGRLLGIERDAAALAHARERLAGFGARAVCVQGTFGNLAALAAAHGFTPAGAVLFDIGVSSLQLDDAARGFSVQADAPLDMRMDQRQSLTAADVVNTWTEEALCTLLREAGDEPLAAAIARAIVRRRAEQRIATTQELARLVSGVYYRRGWRHSRIHPATRTFQAVRIAVNNEFEELRAGLAGARQVLAPGARVAVITFHSGEDRIVKHVFRQWEREEHAGVAVTKRPLEASAEEVARNPRARSAKLRVFELAARRAA